MIRLTDIQEFVDRVVEEFKPLRVILFGSYAYGTPTDDSDVDLLVVMPDGGNPLRMMMDIRARVPRDFPMDLIVRDPDDLRWRIAHEDWFLTEAVEKGRVLYEADHR